MVYHQNVYILVLCHVHAYMFCNTAIYKIITIVNSILEKLNSINATYFCQNDRYHDNSLKGINKISTSYLSSTKEIDLNKYWKIKAKCKWNIRNVKYFIFILQTNVLVPRNTFVVSCKPLFYQLFTTLKPHLIYAACQLAMLKHVLRYIFCLATRHTSKEIPWSQTVSCLRKYQEQGQTDITNELLVFWFVLGFFNLYYFRTC